MSQYKKRDPSLPPADLPTASGKEIGFDKDKIHDIAKALQKDLDDLNTHAAGTYNDLTVGDHGLIGTEELGNYGAAQGLAQTCNNAYTVVSSTYSQFLTSYQQFIDTLKQSAGNYGSTEDANTQAAQQAGNTTGNYTA